MGVAKAPQAPFYLQVDALQQLVEGLGLEPLALAGAPALAGGRCLLGEDVHVDELEGAHPVVEQPGPGAHRRLLNDADDVPFLGQGRWGWRWVEPSAGSPATLAPSPAPTPGSCPSPQPRAGHGVAHPQLQRVLVIGAGREVGVDAGSAAEGASVGCAALLQPQALPGAPHGAEAGSLAACRGEGGQDAPGWRATGWCHWGRAHRWRAGGQGFGARPPPSPGKTAAPSRCSAPLRCQLGTGGMGTLPPPPPCLPAGGNQVRPQERELPPTCPSSPPLTFPSASAFTAILPILRFMVREMTARHFLPSFIPLLRAASSGRALLGSSSGICQRDGE